MIQNYRIPVKKGVISKEEYLHVSDDSDLKDALYSKIIEKAKVLSFKNSNVKDDTFRLLWEIKTPLQVFQLDLSKNFSFVTDIAIDLIVQLPCFKNLKVLILSDNNISDKAMEMISKASLMQHLEELVLFGNTDISGLGLAYLS